LMGLIYGDLLMNVLYRVRPYERIKGSANKLYEKWAAICTKSLRYANRKIFKEVIREIVKEFEELEVVNETKPKVGLVGEILVKFHPTANNNVVNIVETFYCIVLMAWTSSTDICQEANYLRSWAMQLLRLLNSIGVLIGKPYPEASDFMLQKQ